MYVLRFFFLLFRSISLLLVDERLFLLLLCGFVLLGVHYFSLSAHCIICACDYMAIYGGWLVTEQEGGGEGSGVVLFNRQRQSVTVSA